MADDVVCGHCGSEYGTVPVGDTEQCDWISRGERCDSRVCPRGYTGTGEDWTELDGVPARFCREHVGPGFRALYAFNVKAPRLTWEARCEIEMKAWIKRKREREKEKKKGLVVAFKKKSGPRFKDIPHQTNVLEK